MPVLSEETSMCCKLWVDDARNAYLTEQPGTRQCGGITHVDHTQPYDEILGGKTKRRVCKKCGHYRDSFEHWTNTFIIGRIDTLKVDERPRLPGMEEYPVTNG